MAENAKREGTVVWYNERKGYGFINVDGEDIFIHHTTLDRSGVSALYPGDVLTVDASENERGAIIHEILGIERAKPKSVPLDTEPGENEVKGTVRFFSNYKGYGFVDIGEDERDVFVHFRTLREGGIPTLSEGQQVLIQVDDDGKGPHATSVRLFMQD